MSWELVHGVVFSCGNEQDHIIANIKSTDEYVGRLIAAAPEMRDLLLQVEERPDVDARTYGQITDLLNRIDIPDEVVL